MLKAEGQFHSSYNVLAGTYGTAQRAPSPLFLGQGFTDDLFWADQALIYYNFVRAKYPSAPIEVLFGDIGHQRANSKPADLAVMRSRIQAFFEHYVKGTGPKTPLGVTALTQTCPVATPSDGPYVAASWVALHPAWSNSTRNRVRPCFPPAAILRWPRRSTQSTAATPVRPSLRPTKAPAWRRIDSPPPPVRDIH